MKEKRKRLTVSKVFITEIDFSQYEKTQKEKAEKRKQFANTVVNALVDTFSYKIREISDTDYTVFSLLGIPENTILIKAKRKEVWSFCNEQKHILMLRKEVKNKNSSQ